MQHYNSLEAIHLQNAWLTIGIFDGVHRGHQEILRALISGARGAGEPAVVLTFSPHPAVVLGGKSDFKYLTTPDERVDLLGSLGVDVVITQAFDHALANQTASEFMHKLVNALNLRHLIIGYDTALGRGREADAARLQEIGNELGFSVQVVPALADSAGILSSTRIRRAILAGNVSAAASDMCPSEFELELELIRAKKTFEPIVLIEPWTFSSLQQTPTTKSEVYACAICRKSFHKKAELSHHYTIIRKYNL